MSKLQAGIILSILGLFILILLSTLLFSIINYVDEQDALAKVSEQIGYDYSDYTTVKCEYVDMYSFGKLSYIKYVSVIIQDNIYIYKVVKDRDEVRIDWIK